MARKPLPSAGEEAPVAERMIVTARVHGFRRAGRAWSATPTEVPVAEFSAAELQALAAEPLLDVAFVAAGVGVGA